MSTELLHDAVPKPENSNNSSGLSPQHCIASNCERPLLDRFCKRHGGWFIKHGDTEFAGPFADKADAQMALLYYSARQFWPNQKQLREFARRGE